MKWLRRRRLGFTCNGCSTFFKAGTVQATSKVEPIILQEVEEKLTRRFQKIGLRIRTGMPKVNLYCPTCAARKALQEKVLVISPQ